MAKIDTPKKYADFHAPEILILVNGEKISRKGISVSEAKIDLILNGAGTFSFVVPQALDDKFVVKHPGVFHFGDKVEISLGYKDRVFPVITGIITSLSWNFDEDNYLDLLIEGFDYLFLLMKNEKFRAWNEKTDNEVIREIVNNYPLKELKIENTPVRYPQIRQEGESDFNFLKRLAERNGYEYMAEGETFIFRPPAVNKEEMFILKLGRDLLDFIPKVDISKQVSEVKVVGWDPKAKKEIISSAKKEDIANVERKGETGSQAIKSILKGEVIHEVRASVQDAEEAKVLAKSLLFDIAYSMVKSECKALGLPEFRPGQVVQLENVGELFSRKYYVERVTHEIGKNGYETYFSVKGNTYNESY